MIGKAKAISHGINDLRYIMGESKNKKHPEKINFICCRHLPQGLDAMGVGVDAGLFGRTRQTEELTYPHRTESGQGEHSPLHVQGLGRK